MPLLGIIRHASTDWNELGLIQGRSDRPLSERGRADVARWRLPADWPRSCEWVSSPLQRAVETATLLAGTAPRVVPALVEADWGAWEGFDLATLRAREDPSFAENEARGLDFRPAGGESPREVLARVQGWLATLSTVDRPTLAITHKGVIRALLVAATGWDMIGKPPVKLASGALHTFSVDARGRPTLARCNMRL